MSVPLPARFPRPLLLLGVVSGHALRRDVLRCTWLKALRGARLRGAASVLFVVGINASDAGASDVLSVPVQEQLMIRKRRRAGGQSATQRFTAVSSYSTYSSYVKTVHFLRHAAGRPEPVIALADDE